MNIKANVDFIHNGQRVRQAEVVSLPHEEGSALVSSGLAFETSETPEVPETIQAEEEVPEGTPAPEAAPKKGKKKPE